MKLAGAISLHESGNDFSKHGESGELGSFQFMPTTWASVSREVTGTILPQTELNERYVAVMKIQKLIDKGFSDYQIALIWNGSLAGSEVPTIKKGTNKHGVRFNTKAYAEEVTNIIRNI